MSPELLVTAGIFLIGVAFQAGVSHRGLKAVREALENGIGGTHARLDRVNGRLDRHDREIADVRQKHGERIASLEATRDGCG
jgi:hypothetical protein